MVEVTVEALEWLGFRVLGFLGSTCLRFTVIYNLPYYPFLHKES